MCNFKSGIILKNRVVLAPEGRESHSDLLESLNIEDNHMNASKVFVRAELTPPDSNRAKPVSKWKYKVDQDIVPEWYEADPERYELEMRKSVGDYMKERLKNVICEYDWTPIKDGQYTYYFMNGFLFESEFGKTNDYKSSYVREKLSNSDLLAKLKEKFGDKLLPIKLDLTSTDGLKDYGSVEGDLLSIPNIELLMRFGDKIPLIDRWCWLATPNQTPTRNDAACVRCVDSDGGVGCRGCFWGGGAVRPFYILKS